VNLPLKALNFFLFDCEITLEFVPGTEPVLLIRVLLIRVLLIRVLLIRVLLIRGLLIRGLLIRVLLIRGLLIRVLLIRVLFLTQGTNRNLWWHSNPWLT